MGIANPENELNNGPVDGSVENQMKRDQNQVMNDMHQPSALMMNQVHCAVKEKTPTRYAAASEKNQSRQAE